MQGYIARRLLLLIPVFLGISVMVFVITHVLPGDPVAIAVGGNTGATGVSRQTIDTIRHQYGLDEPLYIQYLAYMRKLLHGDFGVSLVSKRPVADELVQYLPATIELTLVGIVIAIGIGIPVGILSAAKRRSLFDRLSGGMSSIALGLPGYWLAIVLLVGFYAVLKWFPSGGRLDPHIAPPRHITGMYVLDSLLTGNGLTLRDSLYHLVLPAFALSITPAAAISRMTRASMLDVLTADYVRTARAKGMTERVVVYRHALRNALIPTTTQIGLLLANFFGGAFFVEWVFNWNGIGRYAVTAVTNNDFNPVMAVTLIVAIIYVLMNLLVDVFYTVLDPRIRYT